MKLFHALILGTLISSSAFAYTDADLKNLWRNNTRGESSLLASNTFHFWAWSQKYADSFLHGYLGFTGQVLGDPHPSNVFDYRANGETNLSVVDIDDGGVGPLFLDFARYALFLDAATQLQTKNGEVFAAYLRGLRGIEDPTPAMLKAAAELSADDIVAKHEKYIRKHTNSDGTLKYKDLGLTPPDQLTDAQQARLADLTRQAVAITGRAKAWSQGYMQHTDGSSAGMDRYWILLGGSNDPDLLIEFKEEPRAATDYYQPQAPHTDRVNAVVRAYSEAGLDPRLFRIVTSGSETFWMRPRHFQALKVGENSAKDETEFAVYIANWMGRKQALQPGGPALRDLLLSDPKAAEQAAKEFGRAYRAEVAKLAGSNLAPGGAGSPAGSADPDPAL